ncbi:hypothetical protein F5Y09DRAFT_354618 [Xylaria sp. FL1042]|nr:hypothetical protein F5Y09DRAFT_354618 [Xylaria sp. FL1042]
MHVLSQSGQRPPFPLHFALTALKHAVLLGLGVPSLPLNRKLDLSPAGEPITAGQARSETGPRFHIPALNILLSSKFRYPQSRGYSCESVSAALQFVPGRVPLGLKNTWVTKIPRKTHRHRVQCPDPTFRVPRGRQKQRQLVPTRNGKATLSPSIAHRPSPIAISRLVYVAHVLRSLAHDIARSPNCYLSLAVVFATSSVCYYQTLARVASHTTNTSPSRIPTLGSIALSIPVCLSVS